MHWLVVVGLILLGLILFVVAAIAVAKRAPAYDLAFTIDEKPDLLHLHFSHWLPTFFSGFDVTLGDHAWFRGSKPDPKMGGPDVVQRWQAGHVLAHRAHEHIEGEFDYWISTFWQRIAQHWPNRAEEKFANRWQSAIAAGTCPFVQCPQLAEMFPYNLQEPVIP